jgi:hypothetical protein
MMMSELARLVIGPDGPLLNEIEPELLQRLLSPQVTLADAVEAAFVLWPTDRHAAALITERAIQKARRA